MLYIHVPYCKGKCIYCDFYSSGNPDWDKYIRAVASELSERIDELRGDSLSSIYFGGGTPSLMPPDYFIQFQNQIHGILRREGIEFGPNLEITLEVNPEDVNSQNVDAWHAAGINRISMGVQSMVDEELKFLKRRHSAAKVEYAAQVLNTKFDNISLDLIYGIPGQSVESLEFSLEKMISLSPRHISAYSLTYEPRTPLTILRDRGTVRETEEALSIEMEGVILDKLKAAGYERYEISNFAKKGFRSRHNSGYWKGLPYLGLGPSASSYDGKNIRRTNPNDLKGYLENFDGHSGSKNIFYNEEILGDEELVIERIFVSLRTKEGLDLTRFEKDFGKARTEALKKKLQRWTSTSHIGLKQDFLSLTDRGFSISDHIILDLI